MFLRTLNGFSPLWLKKNVSETIVSELFYNFAARFSVPKPIGADRARLNRTLAQALGTVITQLRVEKQWSQEELAHRVGYDQGYIRRLERGTANPSIQLLYNLADALSVRLSGLIERAESSANNTTTPTPVCVDNTRL